MSRPLFSGSNQLHRIPRVVGSGATGASGSTFGSSGASSTPFHNYASTAYPPPQYTTANPNRCPPNSNDTLFGSRPYVTPSAEEAAAAVAELQRSRRVSDCEATRLSCGDGKTALEMASETEPRPHSDSVIEDGRAADHVSMSTTVVIRFQDFRAIVST